MKYLHGFLILSVTVGACIYFVLSNSNEVDEKPRKTEPFVIPRIENLSKWEFSIPKTTDSKTLFAENAIEGEFVIHFADRDSYLEYLEALAAAGLTPLGKIDPLLSIRVSEDIFLQMNPAPYGGEKRLSYRIERPLPPVEINPALLAQLQAFGESARTIVGGRIDGDGSGILVGVLDSGIEDHPYFEDVNIDSMDLTEKGISSIGADHGTAVASIIAGREGIAPAADLLVIRVLDDQGVGSSFDLAAGIVHAVDLGAQIINLSLGVYQNTRELQEAVRYAQAHDVILVAAAGNDGYNQLPYPAGYSQVLSVTAVDGRGRQALFPNQSESIDFAAPGVGIFVAAEEAGAQLFSGTSAAAPFVSGTLAALLSADSTLSPEGAVDLVSEYLDEAGAVGPDPVYGGGLLSWDRLRERITTDVNDIALADIYLQSDAQPGTMMPVEVTVQNRGTSWITAGELVVLVGDSVPVEFVIGALAPGQTTSRKIHTQVPAMHSDQTLQVAARVLPESDLVDVRPDNNVKAVYFRHRISENRSP